MSRLLGFKQWLELNETMDKYGEWGRAGLLTKKIFTQTDADNILIGVNDILFDEKKLQDFDNRVDVRLQKDGRARIMYPISVVTGKHKKFQDLYKKVIKKVLGKIK